ncbi:MAG TPA: hypothetical protein PKM57_01370 [Kiritimatiellia bacterium]|nr:hypothetical protein [Kiritimatiellia bacterium]HPS07115.1 hypothetical protein [Kiritimatiellia bacterium]
MSRTRGGGRMSGALMKAGAAYAAGTLIGMFTCSCMNVTYDMRKLEHPVVMNANPFLSGAGGAPAPDMSPTGSYQGKVSRAEMVVSSGQSTASNSTRVNDAQVKAFLLVGGEPSEAITRVRLDSESVGLNLLFALNSGVSVVANGSVNHIVLPPAQAKGGAR